jgi:hypothetical protein
MKDIDRLKRLNILERAGLFAKNSPGKLIALGIVFVLLLTLILFSPQLISMSRQHTAENYIKSTEPMLENTLRSIEHAGNTLEGNKQLFKEYEKYGREVSGFEDEYSGLREELDRCKSRLTEKNPEYVLKVFSHYKDEEAGRVLFPDKVKQLDSVVASLFHEISEVIQLDQELESTCTSLSGFLKTVPGEYDTRKGKLEQILKNGKNARVTDQAKVLFDAISSGKEAFSAQYSKVPLYSAVEEGKYSLQELKAIREQQSGATALHEGFRQALSRLDSYWDELQDQYFTIVTRHYSQKSVDQVIEPNPRYREWTETENYQENETRYRTETYTERVYVGSRIVGDTKEDIYETQTKTRQVPYQEWVTKTRQVTRNNGESREIPVPYDVYQFFCTVEEHRTGGTSFVEKQAGQKHEKYDSSIQSWDYREDEEIGYVVWKQKWNDKAGLVTGKGVKAELEE